MEDNNNLIEISGVVDKVFFSSDTWVAFMIVTNECESVKCSGSLSGLEIGMNVKLIGSYQEHPKYGMQFAAKAYQLLVGTSRLNIEKYLTSSAISGVGPALAKRIVEKFGSDTIDVIRNSPEKLTEVNGISKKKAKKIHDSEAGSQVFFFLMSYVDISTNQAITLYEKYGNEAINIIKNNPYKIIYDIKGFGFKTVDKIALKNGFSKDSPIRIAAAITYYLTEIGNEGHCHTTIPQLELELTELLPDTSKENIAIILAKEIEKGKIIAEGTDVYGRLLYNCELSTAQGIVELLNKNCKSVPERYIQQAISDFEFDNGFTLEPHQKNAIRAALSNNLTVITGGPGTGKSTIIKVIVDAWMMTQKSDENIKDCVHLCAPTGKASRRIAELVGCEAETIQRIIAKVQLKNKEDFLNTPEIANNSLLIIDECSMVDIYLATDIIRMALKYNLRLVLIGDTHQLPPIGPGNFFKDLCDSPCVPSVTLKLCHRQKGTIAINANRVNEGGGFSVLNLDDPSFEFVSSIKENAREKVIDNYINLVKLYGVREVGCIVPMRKKGKGQTSAEDLNEIIREKLNPERPLEPKIKGVDFRMGDRVMNTVNDYTRDVYNGDCGIITDIDALFDEIIVTLDSGKVVPFSKVQANNLILSYAITVHKSQGSEYKACVIACNMEHAYMLQRNLLYTAITRAKEKIVFIGEPKAINLAVKKLPSFERMRKLKLRIGKEVANAKKKQYHS